MRLMKDMTSLLIDAAVGIYYGLKCIYLDYDLAVRISFQTEYEMLRKRNVARVMVRVTVVSHACRPTASVL